LKVSLVERAGTAWNGDIMPLQSFIMQVMEVWDQLRCGPCPVAPVEEKLSHMKQEADEYEEAWTIRNSWVDSIGIREDGWVENDHYSTTKELNEQLRKQLASTAEQKDRNDCWQLWPFKDDSDRSEWVDPTVATDDHEYDDESRLFSHTGTLPMAS